MMALDTGICAPESRETLRLQQGQLQRGKRVVQMFPLGTEELELLEGCERIETPRGIFHFRPGKIEATTIEALSSKGQENKFLNLGPFSKWDVAERASKGEKILYITEYLSGHEIRSAVGTQSTKNEQVKFFESTKETEGRIVIGPPPVRLIEFLTQLRNR